MIFGIARTKCLSDEAQMTSFLDHHFAPLNPGVFGAQNSIRAIIPVSFWREYSRDRRTGHLSLMPSALPVGLD
jgi:hypothetical protein